MLPGDALAPSEAQRHSNALRNHPWGAESISKATYCGPFRACSMGFHVSRILFGDTTVPNKEQDYILLLGYSILYKNIILQGSTTKNNTTHVGSVGIFKLTGLELRRRA